MTVGINRRRFKTYCCDNNKVNELCSTTLKGEFCPDTEQISEKKNKMKAG